MNAKHPAECICKACYHRRRLGSATRKAVRARLATAARVLSKAAVVAALFLLFATMGNAQNVSSPAIVTAVTVGVASAQAVGAHGRYLLALDNESTTATIACAFGATAAINTAGSFTIPPGQSRIWTGQRIPSDAINCIASAGSTPLTVEE